MEIKLKNMYVTGRRTGQPMAFQATLYINNYKVGVINNDGRGGPVLYHPLEDKGNLLIREAEAWCRKLPPVVFPDTLVAGKPMTIPMDFEIYLDNIISAWLDAQDLQRFRRKMEKEMRTGILFGIPDKTYRILRCCKPVAFLLKSLQGQERLRKDIKNLVIPLLGKEDKILNTNISSAHIGRIGIDKRLWIKAASKYSLCNRVTKQEKGE